VLVVTGVAHSHPHIFIETKVQINFNDTGLVGFRVDWVFDDMFSSTISTDYDRNRNGAFESDEIDAVREGAFSNLRNYNYFILLVSENREVEIEEVQDFKAEIIKSKVRYSFFIPFKIEADSRLREIKIGVFDDTYFCDVKYAEESPVVINGRGSIDSSYRLVKDTENAYYCGQIIPKVILLQFKKK
jgi:ABC-type uncharacterized transport system substrate-binding protein